MLKEKTKYDEDTKEKRTAKRTLESVQEKGLLTDIARMFVECRRQGARKMDEEHHKKFHQEHKDGDVF